MRELKIGDLMLPVGDYASIHEGASILEGILALQDAQQREFEDDPTRHRDRAVLVKDAHGEIIGKLSMWSIILVGFFIARISVSAVIGIFLFRSSRTLNLKSSED